MINSASQQKNQYTYFAILTTLSALFIVIYSQYPGFRYERQNALLNNLFFSWLAQFSHVDGYHALMNTAGLGMLTWGFQRHFRATTWLTAIIICSIGTAAWIALDPTIGWYCGASGWLHGLLVYGIIAANITRRVQIFILLGLLIKLMLDEAGGTPPTLPLAHIYGSLMGLALGISSLIIQKCRQHLQN